MALPRLPPGLAAKQHQVVTKAVFLDRDGVINRSAVRDGKPYAPRTLEEFELFPDTLGSVHRLASAGYLLFVVTNQPDIGNKLVDPAIIDAMHAQLRQTLPITEIYCCPHSQTEGCACRKPKAGMLLSAKGAYDVDMSKSFMIGDRYSDVEAGFAAGCTPIFIDHEYVETPDLGATLRVNSLTQACDFILGEKNDH